VAGEPRGEWGMGRGVQGPLPNWGGIWKGGSIDFLNFQVKTQVRYYALLLRKFPEDV